MANILFITRKMLKECFLECKYEWNQLECLWDCLEGKVNKIVGEIDKVIGND